MNKVTKIAIVPLIGLTLLLSGCSTPALESKPEYDQLEVIAWELCLNNALSGRIGSWEQTTRYALEDCEGLKPKERN